MLVYRASRRHRAAFDPLERMPMKLGLRSTPMAIGEINLMPSPFS